MKTLKEANAASDEYSKRASENVRFLALAGLGLVWMLAGGKLDGLRQTELLLVALGLVVVLLLDFAHYVVGARIWDEHIKAEEAKLPPEGRKDEAVIQVPGSKLRPIYVPYYGKIGLLVLTYVGLAGVLIWRIFSSRSVCL